MAKNISPELKEYVKNVVKEEVNSLRQELVEKLRLIKRQLAEDVDEKIEIANKDAQNKQLIIAEKSSKQLEISIKREIFPKLQAFAKELQERTLDGGEMVTQYRRQVMSAANSGMEPNATSGNFQTKAITNGTGPTKPESKRDFQKKMFVFNEDD